MGDQNNQPPQPPTSIDPSVAGAVQPTAQAYPQQGLGGGITSFLSNPLVQGALATYLGAVGTPRQEGLGGAIAHGGLAGLGAFGQAQEQQLKLPLQAAQLQEAQLKTKQLQRELAPLPKDSVQALDDAYQALQKQQQLADAHRLPNGAYDTANFPPPDTTEMASLKTLESQVRGNLISNDQLNTALKSIDDSKRYMEYMHAASYGATGVFDQQMMNFMRQNVPGFPGGSIPAGGQAQQPQQPSSGAAAPPQPRVPFSGTVDGQTVWEIVDTDGKTYYSKDKKNWIPIPRPTATAP